jgi:hypothetical protein
MKNSKKINPHLIALLMLLTILATLVALPPSNEHVPAWKIPTYSYITATPNPVGVGQTVTLAFWLDKLPPTTAGFAGDRWRNLQIVVTKPDGSKQTLGPYDSDPVGSGYSIFTPDSMGTYTFLFSFPGQTLSRTGPTGLVGSASDYENDTYLPSNSTATLTVQQDAIPQPPNARASHQTG